MSELAPRPWEVWHARFNYSEGHGYKFRPVIVLATRPDGLLVAMVTSATNKLSLEHDYPIQEWEAAGLSTVFDAGPSSCSVPSRCRSLALT